MPKLKVYKGGPGSGHYGHAGRPGKHGGSLPGSGGAELDFLAAMEADGLSIYDTKAWLESKFNIGYEIQPFGNHINKDLERIRNNYVVDDERTLANNRKLRAGESAGKWASDTDHYISLSSFKQDSTVYRGAALPSSIVEDLKQRMTFTDAAFMSTSSKGTASAYLDIRLDAFKGTEAVMMRIKAPAGYNVGIMDSGEFVLPRNTTIKFNNYTVEDGIHMFRGEVVP